MSFPRPLEREHFVDGRPDGAVKDALHRPPVVCGRAHGAAQDRGLLPEEERKIGLADGAGGGSVTDQAAALAQCAQIRLPGGRPDRVHDQVDSLPAGVLPESAPVVDLQPVVDGVGAQVAHAGHVVGPAGDRVDDGARVPRDLHGHGGHAPRRAGHQHPLAGADLAAHHHSVPRGHPDQAGGGGLLERNARRNLDQVGGGDHHVVGESTRGVLADDPELGGREALPRRGPIVPVVVQRGVHHHPRADRNVAGAGSHRVHHAGDVRPTDVRQRDVDGQPAPHPQIEMVHRRGTHGDAHLARTGSRIGHLLDAHDLGTAVLVEQSGFHSLGSSGFGGRCSGCDVHGRARQSGIAGHLQIMGERWRLGVPSGEGEYGRQPALSITHERQDTLSITSARW